MNGSYISATTGELHGIPAAEPILQVTFDVGAGGLSDGASALFLIGGSVRADSGLNLSLGTAAPVLKQLGFSAREGGTTPTRRRSTRSGRCRTPRSSGSRRSATAGTWSSTRTSSTR